MSAPFGEWREALAANAGPAEDWRDGRAASADSPSRPMSWWSDEQRALWFSGYVQTYLERDLQALRAVESLADFRRLMRGGLPARRRSPQSGGAWRGTSASSSPRSTASSI
ncbi:MAG: hypothetical protein MZW92_01715 [Comamonadaceae bacterium]|nr:hypothetical protein [Comamonadaceae bacterium]